MATASQVLSVMRSYIGITEYPYGSNRTRIGVAFGWNGVPWCAQTISVACRKVGINWWTASTDQMEAWARAGRNGARWISRSATPLPGDIVVWDYKRDGTANHVSMVESVRSDGKLVTIGGNESNRCQRSVRSRSSYIRGYIRLPYSGAPAPAPKPTAPIKVSHPTLKLGSTGLAVKEYQWKMNASTGSKLSGRGYYGSPEVSACKNFQRFFKLTVDGVCGPKTWGVLDYIYSLKHPR